MRTKEIKRRKRFWEVAFFFFPPFFFVFSRFFLVVILVQIWLCFEDSISFEFLKFLIVFLLRR